MAGYNRTREVEELLARAENHPPSFTVHLHPEYWALNNGSKFLYNNHIASLLDDIRAHRIPVDFLSLFDTARVPFYDGCMIVELLDYRPQKDKDPSPDKPDRTRVVLHPDSETLWADICLLNQKHENKWTDADALEVEARILLATAPPLCLDPNPHLTRIANHILRVSTPTVPLSLKRKAAELEREEDEVDKTRRHKLMSFMNPRPNTSHTQNFRLLDIIQRQKQEKEAATAAAQSNMPIPNLSINATPAAVPNGQTFGRQQTPLPASPQKPPTALKKDGMEGARNSNSPHPNSTTQQSYAQPNHVAPSPSAASPTHQASPANGQYTNGVDVTQRTSTPAQYAQAPPPQQPTPIPRPPSSQPTQPTQPTQPPRPQSRPPSQPQQTNRPTQPMQYPAGTAGHFIQSQSPALRSAQANTPTPQPPPSVQAQAQANAQLMYQMQQMQQQQHHHQARLAVQQQQQGGRSTPQATNGQATAAAARASPHIANQQLAVTRSPMPQPAQQVQMQQQLAQYPHLLRQNPALAAQLAAAGGARASTSPLPPGTVQQQHLQQAVVNGQQQQQQVPMVAFSMNPQMYNYAQMMRPNMNMPYWMGGRLVNGMPNGQPMAMPQGMAVPNASNPQALGVGKAGPAGQAR